MNKKTVLIGLISSCVILSTILVLSFVYVKANNFQIFIAASESMAPTLKRGDVLAAQGGVDITNIVAEYGTGDIIVFHKPRSPDELIVHRAVEKHESSGVTYLTTKGDNNIGPDPWQVYDDDLVGIVVEVNSSPIVIFSHQLLLILLTVGLGVLSVVVYYSMASERRKQERQLSIPRPPD